MLITFFISCKKQAGTFIQPCDVLVPVSFNPDEFILLDVVMC